MKGMSMILKYSVWAAALFMGTSPVLAQTSDHSHGATTAVASTTASAPATMVSGEVRKVDKEQRKLTLSHDPIPNLEMPKMTMVFRVKDPAVLDQVKAGDKVKFAADRIDGQLTVVTLEAAR